jgi:hypothetical protein
LFLILEVYKTIGQPHATNIEPQRFLVGGACLIAPVYRRCSAREPIDRCADLFAAVVAVINAVILRKEKAVAVVQFGHATGKLRHELVRF